jgi:GNAT superfamily N-acetyltransferase
MSAIRIGLAETDEEILECHAVMAELRPHVGRAELLERVRRQEREGYRLLALREGSVVVAVAGFRVGHNLAWGRYLYVDDLVTAERLRSTGHGQRLMDWLREHARSEGCDELHLDSGVQRFGAHRFYLRWGMDITSHHFRLVLERS